MPEQWIFGGICRETREVFMVAVPNRTADVLLGVVREKIREGSTVISDCWSSYNLVRDDVWSFDKISTLSLERMARTIIYVSIIGTTSSTRRWCAYVDD